mgnify:CR=1 FL=1
MDVFEPDYPDNGADQGAVFRGSVAGGSFGRSSSALSGATP